MAAVRRSASTIGLLALAAVTVVLCVIALRPTSPPQPAAGAERPASPADASATGPATPGTGPSGTATGQARTVAVYGDAVTAGGGSIDDPQQLPERSWLSYLGDTGLRYVGGSAGSGQTAEQAAADPPQVDADLHVAFLGLRDAYAGRTIDDLVSSLKQLQTEVAPDAPQSFVVVALGPANGLSPQTLGSWNTALRSAASSNGWIFVDPWNTLRTDDFDWTEERYSYNGTTPSAAGAKLLAENFAKALASAPSPTATATS